MVYPDQDMPFDFEGFDAITLFVQSARKVCPGYDPSRDELARIAAICQTVGGMPLGIELAAAWLHILSVDEILVELEKDLDILATDVRDAPPRHRSIRAVFDTSWSLLDQVEREIFIKLSLFRRGFTRQAAQQVTGASLRSLAGLVDKSFLSHEPDSGRLEVHELLRQYAQERLEMTPEAYLLAQEAHASYYADFMRAHGRDLKGPGQMQALVEIEADIENVRAAWRYYLALANPAQIWKFIQCLWHVYWIRWWNHAGMELFAEAVQALQEKEGNEFEVLRALAMAYQSYFMGWLNLAERGYKLATESLQILEGYDQPEITIFALYSLGLNAYLLTRYEEEYEVLTKMVRIASEIDDKWLLGLVLFGGGMGALVMEQYAEARRLAEWELDLLKEVGDVVYSTLPLIVLGHAALGSGELEEAREYYLRCLKIAQQTGFPYAIQTASKYLGKVNLSLNRHNEAEKYLYQSLKITQDIGFVRDIVNLMYEFARLRALRKDPEGAVELLALVIQHPASVQTRMLEGRIRDSAQNLLADIEREMPKDVYKAALDRGRELDIDVVVASL
jgi:tetratricopeptide (TPR) repeat protein